MCGRYNLRTNLHQVAEFFSVLRGMEEVAGIPPRSNTAPTQTVVCIRDPGEAAGREFFAARWGLIPGWAKDAKIGSQCIMARAETVDSKPAFRAAFKRRRCLMIADGFYEWREEDKQPLYVSLKSGQPFAFAAMWEIWESPEGEVQSCALCTTTANSLMATFSDRMPVILPQAVHSQWLNPDVTDAGQLKPLLAQYPAEEMQVWPVSKRVGNVRNEGPDLIEPMAAQVTLAFPD